MTSFILFFVAGVWLVSTAIWFVFCWVAVSKIGHRGTTKWLYIFSMVVIPCIGALIFGRSQIAALLPLIPTLAWLLLVFMPWPIHAQLEALKKRSR